MDETEKDMLTNAYNERKIASSNEIKRRIKSLVKTTDEMVTNTNAVLTHHRNIPTIQDPIIKPAFNTAKNPWKLQRSQIMMREKSRVEKAAVKTYEKIV